MDVVTALACNACNGNVVSDDEPPLLSLPVTGTAGGKSITLGVTAIALPNVGILLAAGPDFAFGIKPDLHLISPKCTYKIEEMKIKLITLRWFVKNESYYLRKILVLPGLLEAGGGVGGGPSSNVLQSVFSLLIFAGASVCAGVR